MASEEFEFGDVFAGEDFDSDAAKREAHRFLDDWTDNDVSAASDRTRRLAILGAAGLLAAALVPTTTVLAGRIMDAVFYGLLVEVGVMASVHYLFRGVDRPREVLERDIDGVRTVGLIVLLAMAYAATNVRAGRLLGTCSSRRRSPRGTARPGSGRTARRHSSPGAGGSSSRPPSSSSRTLRGTY